MVVEDETERNKTTSKESAIPADEMNAKQLSQISAAEFLEVLGTQGNAPLLFHWPEKKKLELLLDPERPKLDRIDVGRIIDIIQGEKKKREREVDFFTDVINPAGRDDVMDRLADRLAERLIGRLNR